MPPILQLPGEKMINPNSEDSFFILFERGWSENHFFRPKVISADTESKRRGALFNKQRSFMEIFGFVPLGYDGELVRIEVDLRRGIPGIEIVGLPTAAVREARERIRIALQRSGFEYPPDRILVNLSPADVVKTGSGFDIPMALAILAATEQWIPPMNRVMAVGELSLDGRALPVPGILPAVACGVSRGIENFLIPQSGLKEAECLAGSRIYPIESLADLKFPLQISECPDEKTLEANSPPEGSYPLWGHPKTILAMEAVCAGGHSLLLYGPPGTGKTLAARCMEEMGLPLDIPSALEATRLWSLGGLTDLKSGLLKYPPFRSPHHGCSLAGMVGGGKDLSPGEISLAHQGILFLDETPEFAPHILQALREPLEDGGIRLARAGRYYWYPSRFSLVMTANNCPCGQLGKEKGLCLCGAQAVRRYWDRIGNALMDRVDLRVYMKSPQTSELRKKNSRTESFYRLSKAREQRGLRGQDTGTPNAILTPEQLASQTPLTGDQGEFLHRICREEDWSTRAYFGLWRLALTLADLSGEKISDSHLLQAVSLRKPEGEAYWQN